ncbi:nuclear transport factor 2 family protein [Winogradskyella sp. A3E31]|uniref:nuclear transport factor 2 family protein n=1 Tax=Winogradskyella sp. A3E31 TaxID=3349637 RepID=UPI00398A56FD
MKLLKTGIVFSLLLSCNTSTKEVEITEQPKPSINIDKELAKIETLRQNFQQAIKEKRFEDLGNLVTKDMVFVHPASEDWREYYRVSENPMAYDSILISPKETVVLNDSMAYDFGTSKVYYTNTEGNPVELRDTFLVILKKVDGNWKMFREVASATVD